MAKTNPLLGIIDRKLDVTHFREQHWEGTFWDYLDIVTENPAVARNAFQRVYDMILSTARSRSRSSSRNTSATTSSPTRSTTAPTPIFGLERPLMQLVDFFKSAAQGYGTEKRILLLHGPVGSSKSTIARLLKKGLESYSKTDAGQVLHLLLAAAAPHGDGDEGEQYLDCPMHEEPLLLIPREARQEVLDAINEKLPDGRKIRLYGEVCPFCRKIYADLMDMYDGDWKKVDGPRQGQAADPLGKGPPRHRHVPAQGREEPGQHRTDRRHQLPQDRRVRLRLRPARLQLRRRTEHRQPRHRRVHRSAQARRGVPLRPARRQPGTPDQAEEVRPDLHRRSHPRPHQRAGIQEAAGQRDDGGVPRPHHQDRRALQHPARRRDQDLPEGLRPRARSRACTSPRTRSKWRRCGRC